MNNLFIVIISAFCIAVGMWVGIMHEGLNVVELCSKHGQYQLNTFILKGQINVKCEVQAWTYTK